MWSFKNTSLPFWTVRIKARWAGVGAWMCGKAVKRRLAMISGTPMDCCQRCSTCSAHRPRREVSLVRQGYISRQPAQLLVCLAIDLRFLQFRMRVHVCSSRWTAHPLRHQNRRLRPGECPCRGRDGSYKNAAGLGRHFDTSCRAGQASCTCPAYHRYCETVRRCCRIPKHV